MLKVVGVAIALSFGCLGLLIAAMVHPDWLTYEYQPAKNNVPSYLPQPPTTSAGKLTAYFGLWRGCLTTTWYDLQSNKYKSRKNPQQCYDILGYNDAFILSERTRFSQTFTDNITSGITPPTTTPPPSPTNPNHFRTGYVRTISPPTTSTTTPVPNTLAAVNCSLPPDVLGGTYQIDTPYTYGNVSFSRATYSCSNGQYMFTQRDYKLQAFCVNGTWTDVPTCVPNDRCLSSSGLWDVCTTGRAWDPVSIVNYLGGTLPLNVTTVAGFGVFLFPEFKFECDGVIRQWDVYANVSGMVHVSVWTKIGRRYYFIGKNDLNSDGSGLQGFVISQNNRLLVRKGYFIGISYDTLMTDNNYTVVQVYRAADIDQANPFLDSTQLRASKKAVMVNVTQSYVDGVGYLEVGDSSLLMEPIDPSPVVPVIAAYVTGAVMTPIRYQTVQALMIMAGISELGSVCCLILFIIFYVKKLESMLGNSLQAATFINLFSCATGINAIVLLVNEYDCNVMNPMLGTAIYITIAGITLAGINVLLLCIADRRLLVETSRKQFTIVVKPPSATA